MICQFPGCGREFEKKLGRYRYKYCDCHTQKELADHNNKRYKSSGKYKQLMEKRKREDAKIDRIIVTKQYPCRHIMTNGKVCGKMSSNYYYCPHHHAEKSMNIHEWRY